MYLWFHLVLTIPPKHFFSDFKNLLHLKSCLVKCYDAYISSFIFSKKSDRYFSADIHNTLILLKALKKRLKDAV